MDKAEFSFLLKIIDPGYPLFFNSNLNINETIEQKIPDYYNADYHYLVSLSNISSPSITNEDLLNYYQNLILL